MEAASGDSNDGGGGGDRARRLAEVDLSENGGGNLVAAESTSHGEITTDFSYANGARPFTWRQATRAPRHVVATVGATVAFSSNICWYLDATFCSGLHALALTLTLTLTFPSSALTRTLARTPTRTLALTRPARAQTGVLGRGEFPAALAAALRRLQLRAPPPRLAPGAATARRR